MPAVEPLSPVPKNPVLGFRFFTHENAPGKISRMSFTVTDKVQKKERNVFLLLGLKTT